MAPRLDLIEGYLDGDLTPEQEESLQQWLASDRENLRLFVREVHVHRALRDLNLPRRAHEQSAEVQEAGDLGERASPRPVRLSGFFDFGVPWRWLAFACGVGLLVATFAWMRSFPARPQDSASVRSSLAYSRCWL